MPTSKNKKETPPVCSKNSTSKHEHTWTSVVDGRGRCKVCGEHRPRLTLHLRCRWCKELFWWTPRSVEVIARMGVKQTCSLVCFGALGRWERGERYGNPSQRPHSQAA